MKANKQMLHQIMLRISGMDSLPPDPSSSDSPAPHAHPIPNGTEGLAGFHPSAFTAYATSDEEPSLFYSFASGEQWGTSTICASADLTAKTGDSHQSLPTPNLFPSAGQQGLTPSIDLANIPHPQGPFIADEKPHTILSSDIYQQDTVSRVARACSSSDDRKRLGEDVRTASSEREGHISLADIKKIRRRHGNREERKPKKLHGAEESCEEGAGALIKFQTDYHQTGSVIMSRKKDGLVPKRAEQRKPRTPSHYCHICTRITRKLKVAVCGNINLGTCRKVTCEKCIMKNGWNIHNKHGRPQWTCTHCRSVCPSRAQCSTYNRINNERRSRDRKSKTPSSSTQKKAAA